MQQVLWTAWGCSAAHQPCPLPLGWWRDPSEDQSTPKPPTALPQVIGRGTREEVGDILKAAATRAAGLGTPICSAGPPEGGGGEVARHGRLQILIMAGMLTEPLPCSRDQMSLLEVERRDPQHCQSRECSAGSPQVPLPCLSSPTGERSTGGHAGWARHV